MGAAVETIGNNTMNRYATIKRVEVNGAYTGAYEVTMHDTASQMTHTTRGFTVEHARTVGRAWTFYGAVPQRTAPYTFERG